MGDGAINHSEKNAGFSPKRCNSRVLSWHCSVLSSALDDFLLDKSLVYFVSPKNSYFTVET